jgi:hypothetical protein
LLYGGAVLADPAAPPTPDAQPAAPAAPAGAPAGAATGPQRVFGRASAADTTAKSMTVSGFGGGPDTTFTYNADTKFLQDISAQQSDIKVGDTLRAFGQPSDDGKSIAPMFLIIVPQDDMSDPPFSGQFTPTSGVVATITPSLTITTSDNKTMTVDLSGTPRIIKSVAGTASDLKTDQFISAILSGPTGSLVASKIHYSTPPPDGGGN